MPRSLLPGIYTPTQVFYKNGSGEQLDSNAIRKHTTRLAHAGVAGIVANGSNGEAVYLTPAERIEVTRTTRAALDEAGFSHLPVIVGASDQSVQGTLRLCEDAAKAGGDAVLLLVPSFFNPLPVIIYNYLGAVAGIDLDSDLLIRLARHPNIIGTKFTDGNVGKLARVVGATDTVSEVLGSSTPPKNPYYAFAGIADFISPAVEVGGTGAIVGAGNVFPRACVNVYNLAVQVKRKEAMKAQQDLAKADWELTKRAIPGFKAILSKWCGYGGIPRAPMPTLSNEEESRLFEDMGWMMEIESQLQDFGVARK